MWTCPKCGTQVEPPFTVCRSCGAAAPTEEAATAVQAGSPNGPPAGPRSEIGPPLLPVEVPDRVAGPGERFLRGALYGASWGALYGITFAFTLWMVVTSMGVLGKDSWLTAFPRFAALAAGGVAVFCAVFGGLLRLAFPPKKRSEPVSPSLAPAPAEKPISNP
jgi:hypothetical protein